MYVIVGLTLTVKDTNQKRLSKTNSSAHSLIYPLDRVSDVASI